MKTAVFVAFAVAGLAGLALVIAVSPWLLLVGVASIAAGWFYTGGSNPYGYLGLGELFVFVFFGLVATIGSAYVQIESITGLVVALSVAVGLFATALLVVNNLRDREGDAAAGKNTLAVRMGDQPTRLLYSGMLVVGFAIILVTAVATGRPALLIAFVGAAPQPWRYEPCSEGDGNDLIAVLEKTGLTQLAAGLGLALGLLLLTVSPHPRRGDELGGAERELLVLHRFEPGGLEPSEQFGTGRQIGERSGQIAVGPFVGQQPTDRGTTLPK